MLLSWVNSSFLGEGLLITNWTYHSSHKGRVQIPMWSHICWKDYSVLQEKNKPCNSSFYLPMADPIYTAKYSSSSESESSLRSYFFTFLWSHIIMFWAFLPYDESSIRSLYGCQTPFCYTGHPCSAPAPHRQCFNMWSLLWRNEVSVGVLSFFLFFLHKAGFEFMHFNHNFKT